MSTQYLWLSGQFCLHFFFYFLPYVTISYRQNVKSKMPQKGMTVSTISSDFTNLISNHLRILSSHTEHRISDAKLWILFYSYSYSTSQYLTSTAEHRIHLGICISSKLIPNFSWDCYYSTKQIGILVRIPVDIVLALP